VLLIILSGIDLSEKCKSGKKGGKSWRRKRHWKEV
jgi:hypothetical protein